MEPSYWVHSLSPSVFPPSLFEGSLSWLSFLSFLRWYSLMYIIGFFVGGKILKKLSDESYNPLKKDENDTLIGYLIIGMILFARTFYVFVYNWEYYSSHPDEIFAVWKGGLSFHGAVIGMVLATYYFSKKFKYSLMGTLDSMVIAGTPGLFFGRMGNFINGGLYGRAAEVPWAIIFPKGGNIPRHPSQLYEGLTEGVLLFLVLYFSRKKVGFRGVASGMFLCGYGIFRFCVEYFREADSQLGYYFEGTMTMGQILCSIMILIGIVVIIVSNKRKVPIYKH